MIEHPSIKKLETVLEKLSNTEKDLALLEKTSVELQLYLQDRIKEASKAKKGFDINEDGLKEWLKHYWTWDKIPVYHDNKFVRFEIVISIPKIWDESIGWFWKSDIGYNKFKVNSVTNIMGLLPEYIRSEIDFPEPLDIKFGKNNSYVEGNDVVKLSEKYSHHISKIQNGKAFLKPNSYYEFIRELVRNNTNPFSYNPVSNDLYDKKKSNVELRDYQKKSLKKLFDYSRILVLYPTGAGKTYVALEAMNQLKPPFIIFSGNSSTSTQQWKDRIKIYCPEVTTDDYDIFTYQGAITKSLDREYTMGVFDECLTKDTLVILRDGGIKKITDVYNESLFRGGKTKNEFKRHADNILEIRTSHGIIKTTLTHPHIVISRNMGSDRWKRNSTKSIRVELAKNLKSKSDYLLIPDKTPHTTRNNISINKAKFVAMIACDGHIEKNKNIIKVAVSKKGEKEWIRDVFLKGIKEFNIKKYWEFVNHRGDYTIGCTSKNLCDILEKEFCIPRGKKSSIVNIPDSLFYAPLNTIKSFINIVFSSEGWVISTKRNHMLLMAMNSYQFVQKIQLLLLKLGINCNFIKIKRHGNHNDSFRLSIGDYDLIKFKKEIKLSHNLKQDKLNNLKFKKTLKSQNTVTYNWEKYRLSKILEINSIKYNDLVYDFETRFHTFIANGFITHNCHHLPARQWINVTKIKMKLAMGLTASPYREDEGGDEMIVALTGIPDMPDWDYFMKLDIIKKPKCNVWLVRNHKEKQSTLDKILNDKLKTIVFCDEIDEGESLSKKYNVPFVYGKTNPKDRIAIVNSNLLTIVSRVFDESASIPELERTIEFMYHGKSRRQEIQRVGRGLHQQDKTKTPVHHIIMTFDDFEKNKSRLMILSEKNFDVKWHYDNTDMVNARTRIHSNQQVKKSVKHIVAKPRISIPKETTIDENIYPLSKNSRVKKIISMLSKGDVIAFIPFLKSGKTQEGWLVKELMDEYGLLRPHYVTRKFSNILKKKYIIKKGNRYVQNITN